ncbi:MAG: chorismate mutase [Spirochaetaceae bacterium]|jgi:chorismate mutase/prephenate dehydratase|nr:chorismate mutase [Spirochaetaceae bacterium]
MELQVMRESIDAIDKELIALFEKRMAIAKTIGNYKRDKNLSIQDAKREIDITQRAADSVQPEIKGEAGMFMRQTIALSRLYQQRNLITGDDALLPPPVEPKQTTAKQKLRIAYSGVKGAWGEAATAKLFPDAEHIGVEHFIDVFEAINGDCDYGVVPIQNSRTGAIGETYDLLRRYGSYIVKRTQIEIKQCLLGLKDAEIRDIREVHSHPEGFSQCERFLSDKSWDLIPCSNTAVAAKKASESGSKKIAAIGSRYAAETYGLDIIAPDIMDSNNNRTTFACIRRVPEYNSGDGFISLTFSAAHRSGSLCEALLPFYAAGINLTRIESRPSSTPDSYRFFVEIAGNILDPEVISTLRQVEAATAYMEVTGCYSYV